MKNQKGFIVPLLIAMIALGAVGGGIYFYSQSKKPVTSLTTGVSNSTPTTLSFDDSDLRISATRIPDSSNSVSSYNTIKSDTISKTDRDFLTKYTTNYSSKNLPPIAQSEKILSTYSNLLTIFDDNVNKQYQCLLGSGDNCQLVSVWTIAKLSGLRSMTFLQQNKSDQAGSNASNIVTLGKSVTANSDTIIALVLGWSIQKLGYNILTTIESKGIFSSNDKASLIATLRQEQKNALKYEYTGIAEEIDYIISSKNKPSKPLSSDEEDFVDSYRKSIAANSKSWNAIETRKYFYNSYKIALSNVDLACGATPATSTLNLNFNPEDQQTENYIGKTLYTSGYSSLDSLSQKRCEIENLIQNF